MPENDKYTRESDRRFTLRIEKELFKKVEASARAHKRSIGREIEYLLEKALVSGDESVNYDAENTVSASRLSEIISMLTNSKE